MNRAWLFLLLSSVVAAGWAQPSTFSERVHISRSAAGELQAQVNASERLTISEFRQAAITRDGVRLSASGDKMWIFASRRPVTFEFGDVTGELAPETAVAITSSGASAFSLEAARENSEPVRLGFADGAKASVPANGSCRAEFLEAGAYFLTASTNVTAATADGMPVNFSRHAGPMPGGPLREQLDARGVRRFIRSMPVARVELSGSLDADVRSGAASLIAGQEKLLSFTNGVRVLLNHDRTRSVLEWKVVRGIAHFSIAGFSCWKAIASSGQSGTLQWNDRKHAIDLKHDAGSAAGGWVGAQLSGRISASVAPGSTFQYVQFQDCGSFATSAAGDVMLLDRETGESIPVQQGAVAYNEGVRVVGEGTAPSRPFNRVALIWDSDSRIQLRGGGVTYPVAAGTEQTLSFGEDNLSAAYRTDGSVLLRALEGNFTITPLFLQEISIDVPEGGALLLRLNRQRGVFSAEAGATSGADLRVFSGGKLYMYLTSGQARISVILGQNSILPEGTPAWIFFEGAGGEQTFLSGQQPGRVITPTRIDVDRIIQEPVSVIE